LDASVKGSQDWLAKNGAITDDEDSILDASLEKEWVTGVI